MLFKKVLIADVLTNSQPRITIHRLDYLSSLQKKNVDFWDILSELEDVLFESIIN